MESMTQRLRSGFPNTCARLRRVEPSSLIDYVFREVAITYLSGYDFAQ
jgi:hypothetical protein